MEQESDHSNADHSGAAAVGSEVGSDVSLRDERVRPLIAEKDQVVADLARAKLAVEASERELARARQKLSTLRLTAEASERQLAAMHAKIQELNSEKDQLAGQIAQARSAIETAERERVAATSRVQELAKEKDGLVADKERAQAQANVLRDKLRTLDGEGIFGFIKRRYFGRK